MIVIFIIAGGVFLLNQQFQKNLIRQKLEQEELRNKHQLELLHSNIEVQESERKRIAKDLHDQLGATLSIAKMHISRLEQMYPSVDTKGLSLANVREIIDSSITSVRQISHDLMPNQLETFGLIRALEGMFDQINDSKQLVIDFEVIQPITKLCWEKELALYRIFMELIQNTMKHSSGKHVKINYSEDGGKVLVRYNDDGEGLPQDTNYGLGLKSMEARIRSVGGSMEFLQGGGFQAHLLLPT